MHFGRNLIFERPNAKDAINEIQMLHFNRRVLQGLRSGGYLHFDTPSRVLFPSKHHAFSTEESPEESPEIVEESGSVEQPPNGDHSILSVPSFVALHKIAGKLANSLRNEDSKPVILRATGTKAINSAVKTIHVAGSFLRERPGTGISFQVNHQADADKDRASKMQLAVSRSDLYSEADPKLEDLMEEIRCGKGSEARTLGSRLAMALYNEGKVATVGVGPQAVSRMVVSFTWARRVLHKRGYDAVAVPFMKDMELIKDTGKVTGMQILFHRVPYVALPYLDPEEEFNDEELNVQNADFTKM